MSKMQNVEELLVLQYNIAGNPIQFSKSVKYFGIHLNQFLTDDNDIMSSDGYWVRRMRQLPWAPLFLSCRGAPLLKMACVVFSYFVAF